MWVPTLGQALEEDSRLGQVHSPRCGTAGPEAPTGMYDVASFRAEAGTRLGEPPFSDLVDRLLQASDAFRAACETYDIEALPSRERLLRHPEATTFTS